MKTAEADFERMYQQAYYLHSGFETAAQPPVNRRSFKAAAEQGWLEYGIKFAGLAMVMFVVPALAAALVV